MIKCVRCGADGAAVNPHVHVDGKKVCFPCWNEWRLWRVYAVRAFLATQPASKANVVVPGPGALFPDPVDPPHSDLGAHELLSLERQVGYVRAELAELEVRLSGLPAGQLRESLASAHQNLVRWLEEWERTGRPQAAVT